MTSRKQLSYIAIIILVIYFCTKMLWDSIPFFLTEYISFFMIILGVIFLITPRINKRIVRLLTILFLFAVYIVIDAVCTVGVSWIYRGLYENIIYVLVFFATVGYLKYLSIKDINSVLKIMAYCGIILSVLTLVEYARGVAFIKMDGELAYGAFVSGYGYVFRCKVFSRSYLSHGLIMGILGLIELYCFKVYKQKKYLAFYASCIVAVILTSSRGPLVSTFFASIFFLIDKSMIKSMPKKTFLIRCSLSIITVLLLYVVLFSSIHIGNNSIMYFVTRIRNIFNWSNDAGNVGRIIRWKNYIEYFWKQNIWLGIGPATTGTSKYATCILGTTESGVIKRLVELGIVGFCIHYFFVFKIFFLSLKDFSCNASYELRLLSKIALAIVGCILIDDCILQITEEIMISFYFWFALGILYCCRFFYVKKNKESDCIPA